MVMGSGASSGGAVLLLALLAALVAVGNCYSCPDSCTGNCRCASTKPPGGLSPDQVPQMVILTHDDAVSALSAKLVRSVTDQVYNPNGCNIPATFFALSAPYSDCVSALKLYSMNHEMATHTSTHSQLTPTYSKLAWDITSARDWMVGCGIPKEDVVGFRSPYLVHNPSVRQVLYENGFLYDSSIDELFPSATSSDISHRLYPYSWDYGIPQACNWTIPYGWCLSSERYPGLWEVPIIELQSADGTSLATMDPTAATPSALYQRLVDSLHASYYGNRAPVGIYVHSPWFTDANTQALKQFISHALSLPDVWFVTMRQAVEYMRAPVPKSQMGSFIKCRPVDFSASGSEPCQVYIVKLGDFLYNISSAVGVTVSDLIATNPGLSSTAPVTAGMVLKLPPWFPNCTVPAASPAATSSPASAAAGPPCRNHTVTFGDSLYVIAANYSMTVGDVAAVNPSIDITRALMPGTVLRIPPWPQSCLYGNATSAAPSPASSPSPTNPTVATEVLQIDLALSGCNDTEFKASKQTMFENGLAALCGVEASQASVVDVHNYLPAVSRRLLLSMQKRQLLAAETPAQVFVSTLVTTKNATATAGLLSSAMAVGSLASTLNVMGLHIESLNVTQDQAVQPSNSPFPTSSPATGTSPPPAPSTAPSATAGGSSHLGAILGGSIGGGVGLLLLVGAAVFVIRRRRQAADLRAEDGLRVQYGVPRNDAHIPTVILRTGKALKDAEAVSTATPRSAAHRNPTPFEG